MIDVIALKRTVSIPVKAMLEPFSKMIGSIRGQFMEKTDEKVEKPSPGLATQDKLALRDYTNQAIASVKNQELDAIKSGILRTLKGWLGMERK